MLELEAALLAVLTIVLAGPASRRLARASWPMRAPRAALVLWQAIGLGGGLGVLTAGLTLAAADVGPDWWTGVHAALRHPGQLTVFGWCGIAVTACVGLYLVSATIGSTARMLAARRAHRHRVDLVSTDAGLAAAGRDRRAAEGFARGGAPVRVVDHPHAVAYCLPGIRPRVVLTHGALDALDPGQLQAVLAHEQAHARGHHDMVIQPFIAWARTFPFLRPAREAVAAVGLLVEMLADDAALARCDAADLTGALGRLVDQHLALGAGGSSDWRGRLDARLGRLDAGAPAGLGVIPVALVYSLAVAIVVLPPALLLAS